MPRTASTSSNASAAPVASTAFSWPHSPDPFLSLEELDDPAVLAWVEQQNTRTRAAWCNGTRYETLKQRLAAAYLPHERPVIPRRWKDWAYDFWQDEHNPKGIWRRTSWASWRAGHAVWQNLLDFDALGEAEDTPWVCMGLDILYPDGDRVLVTLSSGGSDAVIVREFDIDTQQFLSDGFVIATAGKHTASWIDRDTLYVGWAQADESLTRSGYPREVRRWTRGTALTEAPVVFRGEFADISVAAGYNPIDRCHMVVRSVDSFDSHSYYLDAAGAWQQYDVPSHVAVGAWEGWLLFEPRLDWTCEGITYAGGALLAAREHAFLAGERRLVPLFTPTSRTSACGWTYTRHHLIVSYLEDVQSRTTLWQPHRVTADEWQWTSRAFPARANAQVGVSPVEPTLNDEVFVGVDDYLLPPEYWLADLTHANLSEWSLLDRWPTQFDATPYTIQRGHAQSADGTRVPYTIIGPRESQEAGAHAGASKSTPRPCLLTGYGGFAVPLTPSYLTGHAQGWLEQGGVLVVAHIRGGGEFGSAWHTAAQREHRQRSFDDFIAVAEALIDDGVTTATQLGIKGESNGGLLVGACMVQRPELFGAVVCEVPLLDMSRYHLLHAGASWIDEYGDPDEPDEARILAAYSPYHQVSADVSYPPVLFTTSTSDDRVHPGHARKMVARMQAMGGEHVWYRENTDGGHGGGSDALELAANDAMVYVFLWSCLATGTAGAKP
ncbi:prolyl oligopeptidase family protein [Paraburkholderia sp. DHOC27]|uniref:prolyl oligopeptidase family serine peptidase n=1 Tax=Paraburkholderia sp. DHOC27 TaxID=2303330 RepID=UPI000E3B8F82|nr:prolyl oligopeptidase family serine peptidase [Paraburkholderia sp. DHOC27]RFU45654.1 S9 family peptidase [Paraburkholderia sp. DHOC27]